MRSPFILVVGCFKNIIKNDAAIKFTVGVLHKQIQELLISFFFGRNKKHTKKFKKITD
jgi:hypothetical protein